MASPFRGDQQSYRGSGARDLAGGFDAPVVVIPTAGGGDDYDQSWSGLRQFKEAGAKKLTVVHTNDRARADSAEFVRPIQEARGVFFTGGRQWHLADSYLNTATHRALQALLDRGGVIGGTSAGASILGSFLVRGDTKNNEIMIGDHIEVNGRDWRGALTHSIKPFRSAIRWPD